MRNAAGERIPLRPFDCLEWTGGVEVRWYHTEIHARIKARIQQSKAVLILAYNLFEMEILEALKREDLLVGAVVQRSEHWLPGMMCREDHNNVQVFSAYQDMRGIPKKMILPGRTCFDNLTGMPSVLQAVRGYGQLWSANQHSKSFIFCDVVGGYLIPEEFWTGSYNCSRAAKKWRPKSEGPNNEMIAVRSTGPESGGLFWNVFGRWADLYAHAVNPILETGPLEDGWGDVERNYPRYQPLSEWKWRGDA